MKKTSLLIFICFALLLAVPVATKAFSVKTGDSIYIPKGETVEGNLFSAGATITVDGIVTGDVICAGQTVNINGTVDGDVICAAETININGTVNGNARVAGSSISINGKISRNVMGFGSSIYLDKNASVGWDLFTAGASGEFRGKIGRNLHGFLANAVISGKVGQDVQLKLNNQKPDKSGLTISEDAQINGNVIYSDKIKASIAESASIAGITKHDIPKIKSAKKGFNFAAVWMWAKIYSIFSALVIGLVLVSLWKKDIEKITDNMLKKPGSIIGWGAVVMILTPIIAILLLITLIGMPLAIIIMGLWMIALCISKLLVGILVGRKILEKIWKNQKKNLLLAMVFGIIVSYIIFSIPIIGWLLGLVAMWWGLGAIFMHYKNA
ncbi:MAG: polymer-forming cytoskeletal protein [Candidatus Falkowbacteria bacterium]